jgi:hypothetical protein
VLCESPPLRQLHVHRCRRLPPVHSFLVFRIPPATLGDRPCHSIRRLCRRPAVTASLLQKPQSNSVRFPLRPLPFVSFRQPGNASSSNTSLSKAKTFFCLLAIARSFAATVWASGIHVDLIGCGKVSCARLERVLSPLRSRPAEISEDSALAVPLGHFLSNVATPPPFVRFLAARAAECEVGRLEDD